MPRALSDDLRTRSVFLYELNHGKNAVATRLGISSKSVSRFARRYHERGSVSADKPGRPVGSYTLTLLEQDVLIQELQEHPERTLSELCTHLEAVCGSRIAISTLHDYFRRCGITRKLLKRIPYQRCEEQRINYCSLVSLFDPSMFVFLDESGFDKRIGRRFGYNFRGFRAQGRKYYGNWGPRITAIPIICTEGLIDLAVFRGNTNEEVFLQFVNQKLVTHLLPFNGTNPRSVVVMDNVPMHRCRHVIEAINTSGALLVYLPSYSPDFNPCENVFSQTKSWIKTNDVAWQVCNNPEEMVFEAFMQISISDVTNFMRFTNYL